MAQAMAFAHPNKGTLIPGQMITVNKYTVQVDRYLSQGGFAHVYLVRTATPVYNTTHHVLKRIAVPDEKMLTEVKQEVDVMRLLKGHPNIVHLIDAASHRLPDGTYEVFILMEFCPGGGIIDMMNRRLRERLTEAEILTIFVDVCEGVAHMHNARPALLHRDLKVENILQSSPTSYKLCDFGSAARPSKVPANVDEIRSLEMDLNRHTTLQYRAPEMVDLYLRRPVDEKSDVWALGVLLYKLCYYTTPFEEHGPLAILNVLYKIPPYPVYSPHMNGLIGSMLREHGVHRPSVFELLDTVHRMRGTKSLFTYSLLPPVIAPSKLQSSHRPPASPNPLDSTISYRAAPQVAKMNFSPAPTPSKNAGMQARDKVLEAIAPMRRGRPSKPPYESDSGEQWLNDGFGDEENDAWKSAVKTTSTKTGSKDDAWSVPVQSAKAPTPSQGFGDDFSKAWDSKMRNTDDSSVKSTTTPRTPALSASTTLGYSGAKTTAKKDRDAFEGLGLASSDHRPAPTLGEARKLRTGLATMNTTFYNNSVGAVAHSGTNHKPHPQPMRPSPSPQPRLELPQHPALKPNSSGSSWTALRPPSRPASSQNTDNVTPEARFPSLEELDAQFGGTPKPKTDLGIGKAPHLPSRHEPPSRAGDLPMRDNTSSGLARRVSTRLTATGPVLGQDGVRSQQVTGFAMRETRKDMDYRVYEPKRTQEKSNVTGGPATLERLDSNFQRPSLVRKHHSSSETKRATDDPLTSSHSRQAAVPPSSASGSRTPRLPPRPTPTTNKDWLTGDDDDELLPSHFTPAPPPSDIPQPVLRQSPSKRASYIEKSSVAIPEAAVAQHDHTSSLPLPSPISATPSEAPSIVSRANRMFPPLDMSSSQGMPSGRTELTDNWSPVATKLPVPKELDSASSADEGPEDVGRHVRTSSKATPRKTRKGRQSSVHDLVDLWGGGGPAGNRDPMNERDKEPTRSTITPMPSKSTKAQRRTTLMVSPTKEDFSIDRPEASPSLMSSRTQPPSSKTMSSGQHSRYTSTSTASSSPVSPRNRPQSMFVFPSSDSSAPQSAGLVAPDEPKPRTTRRTSINDMVQKFETIDANARIFGAAKSATPKIADHSRTNHHVSKPSLSAPVETPGPRRASPISTLRTSPRPISPVGHKDENGPPSRVRKSSVKPAPIHTPVPRKLVADIQETVERGQAAEDARSPSPEKPFQGVGRLIDQWQRKAADSDPIHTPVAKRGGMVAKRAGLTSGGGAGRG